MDITEARICRRNAGQPRTEAPGYRRDIRFVFLSRLQGDAGRNNQEISDPAMWTDVSDIRPVVMGELGFGSVHFVSGNYFRTLGVNSIVGRTIQPEDDQEGSTSAVAVISYRFWQKAFGGEAGVLQKPLSLNGTPFRIIGVLPQGFFGLDPSVSPDVMIPISMVQVAAAGGAGVLRAAGNYLVCSGVVGRLLPGVSDEQARADSETWMQQLIKSNPPLARFEFELPKLWILKLDQGTDSLRTSTSKPVLILMTIVGVILLICMRQHCRSTAGSRIVAKKGNRYTPGVGRAAFPVDLPIADGKRAALRGRWSCRLRHCLFAESFYSEPAQRHDADDQWSQPKCRCGRHPGPAGGRLFGSCDSHYRCRVWAGSGAARDTWRLAVDDEANGLQRGRQGSRP